ncbi:Tubulin/FtsZ family, GTPase domain-containing protein [Powellomyces hirtus]|nr:Tubulin/FtsZ family, GTPase domain-containing protein [Powellomyces hirtus]
MIVLQIGQCGIQVGQQLFGVLEQESKQKEKLEYPLSTFRQTIIDTERKTWRKHQKALQKPKFPTTYIDNGTSGRGNNWAHGYWDISHLDNILSTFRKETEASDKYDGCMLLHSVAGGTGSGLGSRMAEELRDAYPKNYLMTYAVTPFLAGDTALQHYNSLLSLGWMQRYSDMIGIFSNDSVMNIVTRQHGLTGAKATPVTLDNLNEYIANCIAGLVLPVTPVRSANGKLEYKATPAPCDIWSMISDMTPMPSCKLTSFSSSTVVSGVAASKRTAAVIGWDDLRTNMTRNMPSLLSGIKRRSISARIQARGVIGGEYWKKANSFETQLVSRLGLVHGVDCLNVQLSSIYGNHSAFNPRSTCISTMVSLTDAQTGTDLKSSMRSLDLCYNGSDSIHMLDSLTTKAQAMFDEKAYLHWYERYGGPEVMDTFDECFETLHSAKDAYEAFLEPPL